MRDSETGEVVGSNACPGFTDDDGVTVTLGIGNVPSIYTAQPGDVTLTVEQPSFVYDPVTLLGVADDPEAGTMVISFELGEAAMVARAADL